MHVAKATTEMKRSGIEVRVARCGRGREVHVAKATTEMERSGIEVCVARCGRGREVHVAKATTEMERSGIEVRVARCGRGHLPLTDNRLNDMHDCEHTRCHSKRNMYLPPTSLPCFLPH